MVTRWPVLSNFAHVLVALSKGPWMRLRDIVDQVGITESAVQRIMRQLESAGFLTKEREGRRNRYRIDQDSPSRRPLESHKTIGSLRRMMGNGRKTDRRSFSTIRRLGGRITVHKSRLSGFIIDCQTDDLDAAAAFWGAALGAPVSRAAEVDGSPYIGLEVPRGEPYVEVQRVEHPSRVHLDIEADDIEAEVHRLEELGARRVADIKDWVVMEAPTGQRFCIVPVVRAGFEAHANSWD